MGQKLKLPKLQPQSQELILRQTFGVQLAVQGPSRAEWIEEKVREGLEG